MKIAIGNDHSAIELKRVIIPFLTSKEMEVIDAGTNSPDSFLYAVRGYRAARLVAGSAADGGVLICGTGAGISLAANKVKGICACVCSDPYTARLFFGQIFSLQIHRQRV